MERLTRKKLGDTDGKKFVLCNYRKEDCDDSCQYGTCEWSRKSLLKLKEYEDLEEQGLLLKLPCKVGDTVYFISEKVEKQGRKKAVTEFVDKGIVDNITFGSIMIPQITVCNDENIWITFGSVEDFGKTVFLTQAEAEDALNAVKMVGASS